MITNILESINNIGIGECFVYYITSAVICMLLQILVALARQNEVDEYKFELVFKYCFIPVCNTFFIIVSIVYLLFISLLYIYKFIIEIILWMWNFGPFKMITRFISDLIY